MYHPDDLRPGDVLLMVGRPRLSLGGVLDALIEYATVSPFDHACIVGDGHLVEALWHVQRSPLDKYAANGWRFSVNATEEQKAAAVAWMEQRIGWIYGIRELMRDGERDILRVPMWPRVAPQRFTCSGLVAMAYQQAGVRLTLAPWPSPADLSYSPLLVGARPWSIVAA